MDLQIAPAPSPGLRGVSRLPCRAAPASARHRLNLRGAATAPHRRPGAGAPEPLRTPPARWRALGGPPASRPRPGPDAVAAGPSTPRCRPHPGVPAVAPSPPLAATDPALRRPGPARPNGSASFATPGASPWPPAAAGRAVRPSDPGVGGRWGAWRRCCRSSNASPEASRARTGPSRICPPRGAQRLFVPRSTGPLKRLRPLLGCLWLVPRLGQGAPVASPVASKESTLSPSISATAAPP